MARSTKVTTDHTEIRAWVEKYQGRPALITLPTSESDDIALRIDFPGSQDEELLSKTKPSKPISWEDFFKVFEESNLAFVYDQRPQFDNPTLAYRFIYRSGQNTPPEI
ncbi:MAG: hypothetical protein ACOX6V_02435 [Patescibacteria group bacterium]|jgi:hypothetical protein